MGVDVSGTRLVEADDLVLVARAAPPRSDDDCVRRELRAEREPESLSQSAGLNPG